jgi:hypothetical protein
MFTKELLKKLSKKDPYIRFLRDTHEANECEERICFYDSLTRATFTLCFQCYKTKLKVFMEESVYFSKSEQLRLCQLQKNLLPFLISSIKEHPTFRIKLTLKEYTIEEYPVDKLHFYSLKNLMDHEFHFVEHYSFVFPFSLIAFIFLLGAFHLAVTHLSSFVLYITIIPLFLMLAFFGCLFVYFFSSFLTVLMQYNRIKKIEELEKSLR